MPGASEEDDYPGHSGIGDDTPEKRLNSTWAQFPPGGLDLAPGLCSAGNLVSQGYADGVSMGGPAGFEACCGGIVPETIQERAISSPIWVRPVPEPNFLVGLWIGGVVLLTKRRTALIRPIGSVARTEGFGPRTPSPICCQEPD